MENKCCNCGGQHRVTNGGCESRKRAVEIQQVKTANNISCAEAVRKVQKQKKRYKTDRDNERTRIEQEQREHDKLKMVVDIERLIVFIAYVINCTDQARNKTEKIRTIVKGDFSRIF
ncbi:uncharacterized protein LOC114158190 [Xyrichtys novacula]|uniref:Uncharacterized protein LOC114158190 n=1 Tax=Xyrichtys novacula TaxID=13765 RepID=A0AAV1GL20_XYRNO|nr:uncharacterized protein LOC114158190 [Xyrichtys novacula]